MCVCLYVCIYICVCVDIPICGSIISQRDPNHPENSPSSKCAVRCNHHFKFGDKKSKKSVKRYLSIDLQAIQICFNNDYTLIS